MKRIYSFIAMLFSVIALYANDADILAMLQANSEVQILTFENDSNNPYTLVGTDSLQSGGSGEKTLRITYQADAVVQLTYKNMVYCILSVDGIESSNYNMYLPAGKHELNLVINNSRRHYIVGLGLKKVCTDADLLEWIQAQSDVKILSFTNDTFDPYVLEVQYDGDTALYNERDYEITYDENDGEPIPGQDRVFEIQYESDSITSIQHISSVGKYDSFTVVVDDKDSLAMGSNTNLMLNPGKHTLHFITSREYDTAVKTLSIHKIGTTDAIKEMIEGQSDVAVNVINDAFHPWVAKGDSIVFASSICTAKKEVAFTLNFHLDKMAKLAFKLHWWTGDSILIDGEKWYDDRVMGGIDTAFILLVPGNHSIVFKHNVPEESEWNSEDGSMMGYYTEMAVYALSIKEIGAMTPIPVNFNLPQEKETYYDIDGDGEMEFLSQYSIQAINWSERSTYDKVEYSNRPYPQKWINLTNDSYLDAYTIHGSNDTKSILLSDTQHQFTEFTTKEESYTRELISLDYNNDGYPDLVAYQSSSNDDLENDKAYTLISNGALQESAVKVLTYREYTNQSIRKYRGSLTCTPNWSLKESGWMIGAMPSPPYKAMLPINIDLNGDGIVDYFDEGHIYINMGDGHVVYQEVSEGLDWVELNNDGVMDAIVFESPNVVIYMLKQDGSYTTKKIYSGAQYTTAWCYDFDKDNDKDILLAFNYSTTLGGSYLILLESIGNDQYKDHEYFFESQLEFAYCVDYDNDGHFEVIGRDATNGTYDEAELFTLEVQGTTIDTTPTSLGIFAKQANSDDLNYHVADVDNDGIMELSTYYENESGRNTYEYIKLTDDANQRPEQPAAPTILYEASTGILSITWEPGKDKESSSADLTYALRIGTQPGKGDIVYAHALADGTRRNRMGGNQQTNRYRLLNTQTWAAGKYYIAVQSVDPNNRGSEFSKEVIIEKTAPACAFDLQYTSPFGVGDTCIVHLHKNVLLSEYALQVSGGHIVDTLANGRSLQVVFNEAGQQTISLTCGSEHDIQMIEVAPLPPIKNITPEDPNSTLIRVAMDMDEDGLMEFYRDEYGFYTYDEQGQFSKINRMWNNHDYITADSYADFYKDFAVDVNKDGMSDVFANQGGSNWFHMLNQGNKVLSIQDDLLSMSRVDVSNLVEMIDLNNDGYLDVVYTYYGDHILKNEGDYRTFTKVQSLDNTEVFKDVNKDGLVDYINGGTIQYNGQSVHGLTLHLNNGDFTFSVADTLLIDTRDVGLRYYLECYFEDFDNDSKLDVIYRDYEDGQFYVHWSNGEQTLLEGITSITRLNWLYYELINEHTNVFDVNNDGYLDISATGGLNDQEGMLLFFSNHQYQFVTGYTFPEDHLPFLTPDSYIRIGGKLIKSENTRPTAPAHISSSQNAKGVTIAWQESQDNETPAVRMRYNISIKKKGATGDGAYLISPCNSTKNGVLVPTHMQLLESNTYFIPLASIPIGEYEVQVQAVDLHLLTSDFSDIYDLKVTEIVGIEAPATTGEGIETTVLFAGNISPTIDWDGGRVVASEGNAYTVVWDSVGMKHITAGDYRHAIYVHALPNTTFVLPSEVMQLATVTFPATNARQGQWSIKAVDASNYTSWNAHDDIEVLSMDTASVTVSFQQSGTYHLRHSIASDYGTSVYEQIVNVTADPIAPSIRMVTQRNGVYQVVWDGGEALPSDVTGIRVYKESSYANIYTLLAELPIDSISYTDWMSMPNVQSSRYALSYVTTYGESTQSIPHHGLHVMINKGMGNTWNLSWAKYEGREVSQYRIWRGTTTEDLTLIGSISGNMTSYSDIMTTDSVNFYAVEVIFTDEPSYIPNKRKSTKVSNSTLSNIVSTQSTHDVTFIEQIVLQGNDIISGTNISSQLYAYVYPYYATYKSVNWVIVQGNEIASINKDGLLTLKNYHTNGTIVVRAYALDGSNIYSEINIQVTGFKDTFALIYIVDDTIWQTQHYKVGETIVPLAEPTKSGYQFSGWSEIPTTMPANDVEVRGNFTLISATKEVISPNDKAIKILENNQLIIILPNGQKYSTIGSKL